MAYRKLELTLDGAVARVTLDDPATLNALGVEMAGELGDVLARITSGEIAVRALLIGGRGRAFCSGADCTAPREPDALHDLGSELEAVYNPLMRQLRSLPVPVVTAVGGAAAGIGASLALMGDLIVASEEAYFLQAFVRIGLAPDGGATWLLPRMVGRARAAELALLGERLPARRALEWGLINRCVSSNELAGAAGDLARRLAEGPASTGLIRRLLWDGAERDFDAQLNAERRAQADAGRTADFAEGVSAFLAKRAPVFGGR